MSESKTTISDNVFIRLAEIALKDIDDIAGKEKKGPFAGLTQMLSDRFSPQVSVKREENEEEFGRVAFELKLAVVYGINIPEAAVKIRNKIIETVEDLTGYKVNKVDIVVDRIVEPKDLQPEPDEAETSN